MPVDVEISKIGIIFEEKMDGEFYHMPFDKNKLRGIEAKIHNNNIHISFREPYSQFDSVIVHIIPDNKETEINNKYYYMINYPPEYHEETLKYYKFILIPLKGKLLRDNLYDNFMTNLRNLPDKELINFLLL